MIDLMAIARTEADGGDLLGLLGGLFESSAVRPEGYPDAVIWQGGNHEGKVNPVAHSLPDAYALLGTLAALADARLEPRDLAGGLLGRPGDLRQVGRCRGGLLGRLGDLD